MVRLEVDNSEDGRPHTVLNEFAIDNEGNPYAIEAEDDQRVISSDDAVSLILKDGETYFKERLVNLEFANGASAELLEQNSNLTRIKILKDKKSFFCSSISKSKDDCQCQSLEESID